MTPEGGHKIGLRSDKFRLQLSLLCDVIEEMSVTHPEAAPDVEGDNSCSCLTFNPEAPVQVGPAGQNSSKASETGVLSSGRDQGSPGNCSCSTTPFYVRLVTPPLFVLF